jgi:hypothetical protein
MFYKAMSIPLLFIVFGLCHVPILCWFKLCFILLNIILPVLVLNAITLDVHVVDVLILRCIAWQSYAFPLIYIVLFLDYCSLHHWICSYSLCIIVLMVITLCKQWCAILLCGIPRLFILRVKLRYQFSFLFRNKDLCSIEFAHNLLNLMSASSLFLLSSWYIRLKWDLWWFALSIRVVQLISIIALDEFKVFFFRWSFTTLCFPFFIYHPLTIPLTCCLVFTLFSSVLLDY